MLNVDLLSKQISTNVRLKGNEMRDKESILKEYKEAGENKRLDMFMFYREYREEFRRIDEEEGIDRFSRL